MELAQNLRAIFSVLFGRPTFNIKTAEESFDYIQTHIQDVADQHYKMKQMVDLMTSTLNGTEGLVWSKDAEGRYLFANHAMIKTLLVPHLDDLESATRKILGKTDAEILAETSSGNMDRKTFLETMPVVYRYPMQNRQLAGYLEQGRVNGKPLLIRMVLTPVFTEEGVFDGIVGCGMAVEGC